jgi:hypothetical protein
MSGLPTSEFGIFGVDAGDLNGDGIPDVAGATAEGPPQGNPPNILWLTE